jgi:hypothetical protein
MEREGWKQAEQRVWKAVQHKPSDRTQKMVRERLGDGLTVVKTREQTVFVTAEPKYQTAELLQPLADDATVKAVAMGELFAGYVKINPALGQGASSLITATGKAMSDKATAAYRAKAPASSKNNADTGE